MELCEYNFLSFVGEGAGWGVKSVLSKSSVDALTYVLSLLFEQFTFGGFLAAQITICDENLWYFNLLLWVLSSYLHYELMIFILKEIAVWKHLYYHIIYIS